MSRPALKELTDASIRVVYSDVANWSTRISASSRKTRVLYLNAPVNCWFPTLIPYRPPLKIKSDMKPPEPFSMNMPTWVVPEVVLILTTISTSVVACATCQWRAVAPEL